MATPGEKLAVSFEELKKIQDKGIVAIKSSGLSQKHRERLLKNGGYLGSRQAPLTQNENGW